MKVVMADNMAVIANGIFSQSNDSLIGADIIIGAYAFTFQIYGDFSGYSLIAIGISKFFGINLTKILRFHIFLVILRILEELAWFIILAEDYLYPSRQGKVNYDL